MKRVLFIYLQQKGLIIVTNLITSKKMKDLTPEERYKKRLEESKVVLEAF